MRAILKKMKSENGAASIIEMTLIFPLVIMILIFLIYLGAYIYDNVTIYNNSQMIAVAVSREVQVPGYEKFYENGARGKLMQLLYLQLRSPCTLPCRNAQYRPV